MLERMRRSEAADEVRRPFVGGQRFEDFHSAGGSVVVSAEPSIPHLLAELERLETETARERDEVAELRTRVFEIEEMVKPYGEPDDDDVVRGRLLEMLCNAIVDGNLELDEDLVQQRTARRFASMAVLVRAELDRREMSCGELDVLMGWPEGRTKRLLAEPSEVSHEELRRLSLRLEIPMTRMFELRAPGPDLSGERRFRTAFKWILAAVAALVLAVLFVAWKIWGV